ncbi:hypothetical protein BVI1335_1630004 [Burkholderia vietnamiensis]|nr:hypothetical protein BVI1335_1630004 [Burkholderia vietnamiensis]
MRPAFMMRSSTVTSYAYAVSARHVERVSERSRRRTLGAGRRRLRWQEPHMSPLLRENAVIILDRAARWGLTEVNVPTRMPRACSNALERACRCVTT